MQYVSWNTKILHAHQAEMLEMPRTPRGKPALSPPGAKSAPRSSKLTIFVKGNVELFNLQQMVWIQYGNLPFKPFNIRYTYDSKLQLEKFRNWRLVSCELHFDTDFEIYASRIRVMHLGMYWHRIQEISHTPTSLSSFSLVLSVKEFICRMFESRYKSTGFVNFIFESIAHNAARPMKY